MSHFYVGNKEPNNWNELKGLAAAASRLKMGNSPNKSERYDKLVNQIIPALEKELDDAHDEYLSVESKIMTVIKKAEKKKGTEKIIEKGESALSEKGEEYAEKVKELIAKISKARIEAKEILRSVAAFKGGQTRARKNRAGTKRLRRR
jgi:predicted ribosome quality control (RQC) complex YloA/Tae2 family protein